MDHRRHDGRVPAPARRGLGTLGRIYGVAIDRMFFGESMFSRETNASKIAFFALCQWSAAGGVALIDCQVESPHLLTLGAVTLPRREFAASLARLCSSRKPLEGLPSAAVQVSDLL